MAAESIGQLIPTKIPGYSDAADIQAALRVYHYGSYTYDPNETNASNLVNPSIAYTINNLQGQINAISAISPNVFNAKGDILSASADNTPAILSAGSNGQVLTLNSATSTGLEWSTPEVTLSNSSTLTNKTLTAPVITTSYNQQTGTTYTLALSDNSKFVELNNASAITLTIPTNATAAFPVGSQINILQTGAGQVTVAGDTGVTLNGTPGLKLRAQWSSASLVKRATDTWVIVGDLSA
jgi:predicted secreted protein